MSGAAANLASSVYLLDFVTKAPKLMWSNKLMGRGLLARQYCSVFRDLDGECFEPVPVQASAFHTEWHSCPPQSRTKKKMTIRV